MFIWNENNKKKEILKNINSILYFTKDFLIKFLRKIKKIYGLILESTHLKTKFKASKNGY